MENTSGETSLFDLQIDENMKKSLSGLAVWAGIAAIVSFAGSILGLVNYFVQRAKIQALYSEYGGYAMSESSMAGGLVSTFISFLIGVVLFVFLMKFSSKTKAGVEASESGQISEGISALSVYFTIVGILIIIVLIFMVFAISTFLNRGF